jgi:hypothetical protein
VNKLYILSPLLTHFDAIHCPIADGFLLYNHSKEIIIKKGQYAISLYVRLTLFFLEALGSIERRFLYFFPYRSEILYRRYTVLYCAYVLPFLFVFFFSRRSLLHLRV